MKSQSTKIAVIYSGSLLILTIISQILLTTGQNTSSSPTNAIILLTIILSAIFIKIVLDKVEKKYKDLFERLQFINKEIKESKDKYDIVAKATSDTIWEWKIEEDILIWNKGIQQVFGYKQHEVETSSKWWF